MKNPGFTEGRDLRTGQVVKTLRNSKITPAVRMGHHRCYRDKATTKYLLIGRDGVEFVDLSSDSILATTGRAAPASMG